MNTQNNRIKQFQLLPLMTKVIKAGFRTGVKLMNENKLQVYAYPSTGGLGGWTLSGKGMPLKT